MARAIHNQVGHLVLNLVWNLNLVKLGTTIASFVYILLYNFFLH